MNALFSTAYWPGLHYFFYVLQSPVVCIEQLEHYQKQSYRNRTHILSANGLLELSIPIQKNAHKELIKDIRISYKENWQTKHWRAITSAYKNSPYFGYFEAEVQDFYQAQTESLLAYNTQQLRLILKLLKVRKEIGLTEAYRHAPENMLDLREKIHPKISFKNDAGVAEILLQPYYQTFQNKFDFVPDLSILDLLFNKGLETLDYLHFLPPSSTETN